MKNREPDIFEKAGAFFTKNPGYFGWFIIVVGVLFLAMAITNGEWLFGNARTFNLGKIEGWVNFFGRNTARVIVGSIGLLIISIGIIWIYISFK